MILALFAYTTTVLLTGRYIATADWVWAILHGALSALLLVVILRIAQHKAVKA